MDLVREKMHQHVPRCLALDEVRTLHRDFGVQCRVVGGVAPGDQPLIGVDLRRGEFGLAEPTGWIEVLGVDPALHGRGVGRALAGAST